MTTLLLYCAVDEPENNREGLAWEEAEERAEEEGTSYLSAGFSLQGRQNAFKLSRVLSQSGC